VTYFGSSANILAVNLGLILQATALSEAECDSLMARIEGPFKTKAWITLEELSSSLRFESLEPIFSLLRKKRLYCLLDKQLLSEPQVAIVSPYRQYLNEAFAEIKANNQLVPDAVKRVPLDVVPSAKQAEIALERLKRLHEDSRAGRRLRRLVQE